MLVSRIPGCLNVKESTVVCEVLTNEFIFLLDFFFGEVAW